MSHDSTEGHLHQRETLPFFPSVLRWPLRPPVKDADQQKALMFRLLSKQMACHLSSHASLTALGLYPVTPTAGTHWGKAIPIMRLE